MTDKEKPTKESTSPGSFDLTQLRELIEMMETHGVTEVHLRQGNQQWRLKRGGQEMVALPMMPPSSSYASPVPASTAPVPTAKPASEAPAADTGLVEIKSPAVGTFYSSPSPDDPPFVKVGTRVSPDSTVCLIEAMKVFNQIPAECAGTVEKVLAKDGDAIEFGQLLFLVRP